MLFCVISFCKAKKLLWIAVQQWQRARYDRRSTSTNSNKWQEKSWPERQPLSGATQRELKCWHSPNSTSELKWEMQTNRTTFRHVKVFLWLTSSLMLLCAKIYSKLTAMSPCTWLGGWGDVVRNSLLTRDFVFLCCLLDRSPCWGIFCLLTRLIAVD